MSRRPRGRARPGGEQAPAAEEPLHPDEAPRYAARSVLAAAALVLLGTPYLLLILLLRNPAGPLATLDNSVEDRAHTAVRSSSALLHAAQTATFLGGGVVRTLGTIAVVALLLAQRRYRAALFLTVTVAVGAVLNSVLKALVERARPALPDPVASASGTSYPSGHAMGTAVFIGALVLLALPSLPRRARPLLVGAGALAVTAVAASRVLLGVHYLSDVIGGVLAGLAWLALSAAAIPPGEPVRTGVRAAPRARSPGRGHRRSAR